MDLGVQEKTALVTGSTAGIGLAIASRLAAEGATVIINGRSQERVNAAIEHLRKTTPNAKLRGFAADLATAAGVAALVAQEPEVDILVNNLGIFEPKSFEEIPDEDWFRFFETNVMSGVRLSRHYLPAMKQRNWGRIVFIASESAANIPVEMVHYGMTKTAQVAVARGLAESTAGTGVTVNSVLPGPTRSEGVATFFDQLAAANHISPADMEAEFFRSGRPSSLLKRFTEPAEIANMVAYVCSTAASATNGAALRAEGGIVRSLF
jgi:NAD(P)-dependent dehydrogenase (short-subunit alcohol dehydrogenase family)